MGAGNVRARLPEDETPTAGWADSANESNSALLHTPAMTMTPNQARRFAFGIALLCLGLVVASVVLLILDWRVINSADTAQLPQFLGVVIVVPLSVLILSRRPGQAIGWLLLAVAASQAIFLAANFIALRGLLAGVSPHGWVEWPVWVSGSAGFLDFALLIIIVLLFPDGTLPSRRWRWPGRFVITMLALLEVGTVLSPDTSQLAPHVPSVGAPVSVSALAGFSNGSAWLGLLVALAVVATALVVRLRRARGRERQQLKWFVYTTGGLVVVVFATTLFVSPLSASLHAPWLQAAANDIPSYGFVILVPAAIGLAVIKFGLYDIDVFISRAIVFGSLAVFITAVYVGIAVGIGALIGGGGKPNLGLSILATAIVATGFQPARERLQKFANRLVYGKRATPYEVLSQFSERVAESYAVDDVLPRMARVLAEGTGAERADVWLRSADSLSTAAVWPVDAPVRDTVSLDGDLLPGVNGTDRMVPVRHQEELLGALSVTKRAGESMTPVEVNLLTHLANQAGLVLKNVGLTADLQARLGDLRASRQRLVTAQDDERPRLERNLHDGAQQHLVALKVKLGLAELLMAKDPEKAKTTIAELKADADAALETLRDLARGIYPPLLAEKGLATALQSHAGKATVPVTVVANGLGRFPQDIEAAVYFCVLEALQNVQKYAQPTRTTVSLECANRSLVFTVKDDGLGFNQRTTRRGAGLQNMVDRIDALGGRLEISSHPGAGTSLRGALPLGEAIAATA